MKKLQNERMEIVSGGRMFFGIEVYPCTQSGTHYIQ